MVTEPTEGLTDDDLRRFDKAILDFGILGEARVRFADGREVTYRSMEELVSARRLVSEVVRGHQRSGGIFGRATVGVFRRC